MFSPCWALSCAPYYKFTTAFNRYVRYKAQCYIISLIVIVFVILNSIAHGQSNPVPISSSELVPEKVSQSNQTRFSPLAYYYGFKSLELYKLESSIQNLETADLNQDGKTDLFVFDNSSSRIDLLIQRDPTTDTAPARNTSNPANLIENDIRMEHVKIDVNRKISSLISGDLNNDGHVDFAYVAPPRELIVRLQDPQTRRWTTRIRHTVDATSQGNWTIDTEDLNADGLTDIVMLGTNSTYLFFQKDERLQPPVRLFNTTGKLRLLRIVDLNGDSRKDLVYTSREDIKQPLHVRFQNPDQSFGPERCFELPTYRSILIENLDGTPGAEVLLIENVSGRLKMFSFDHRQQTPLHPTGPLISLGFGSSSSGRKRDLVYGDLDGDKKLEIIVTDPEGAQLLLFKQSNNGQLAAAQTFPTFTGSNMIRCADFDMDGKDELIIGSTNERTIGISYLENNQITFASPLPTLHTPLAIELADLDADGIKEIIYLARNRNKYELRALKRQSPDQWNAFSFGPKSVLSLTGLKSAPSGLFVFDSDHNGKLDFFIFPSSPNQPPLFLQTNDQGVPIQSNPGTVASLGNASRSSLHFGQMDGPALLVAHRNFARKLIWDEGNRWKGTHQFNAPHPQSKIAAVGIIDLDANDFPEISLVDTAERKLHFLKRESSLFHPWKDLDFGQLNFKSLHIADFNNDGKDDQLLFGHSRLGIAYTGNPHPVLRESGSYAPPLKGARLSDIATGDLNHDGILDIALIDVAKQSIHIVAIQPSGILQHAINFKVFEARSFQNPIGAGGGEPREIRVADVTGDTLPDLILVAHDRILIYPQEDDVDAPAP